MAAAPDACSDATECLDELIQKCEAWNAHFIQMSKLPSVSRTAGVGGVSESRAEKTKSTSWDGLWAGRMEIRDYFTNNLKMISDGVTQKAKGGVFTIKESTKKEERRRNLVTFEKQ
eukprot:16837_1